MPYPIEYKTDHVEEAKSQFLYQFREAVNLKEFLATFIAQIQDIETMLYDLLTRTELSNAVGQHLDNLGSLVGEARSGKSDAVYRAFVRCRILANASSGTPDQIIEIASSVIAAFLGAPPNLELTQYQIANYLIRLTDVYDPLLNLNTLEEFLRVSQPVGVRGVFQYRPADVKTFDDATLRFDVGKFAASFST